MMVHAKWRLPPNEIRVVLQQKMDSNAAKYVGIMTMAGKPEGYVIIFVSMSWY